MHPTYGSCDLIFPLCRVVPTYIDYCKLAKREPQIMVGLGLQNPANLRESAPPKLMTENHLSGWDGQ